MKNTEKNHTPSTQIRLLRKANQGITDFIQSNYARVVADLKRDIRIFTASNALVFLLILALAIGKPQACLQLFVPGILAATAALACSYFYIFEQNWLLTILFNDYLGFTYLAYLAVVFALLCDITLNRARVTTEIVNAVLEAIGSVASAVPCQMRGFDHQSHQPPTPWKSSSSSLPSSSSA